MSQSQLISLKTDLKSLKYGEDRPGSSNSGQPYIVTDIPDRSPFVSSADDGFVRGGATTADRASKIDTERISRFFKDKTRGPLFIQRQIGLQFSNPKLEVKKYPTGGEGILGGLLSLAASTFNVVNELVPGPTRLYNNGFNTLSQVGVNAFGQHFNRHGLTPVQDDNSKYFAVVRYNNENGNNRLVGLKNKLLKEKTLDGILSNRFLNSVNFVVSNINALFGTRINTIGLQPPELTIDSYQGGPGSVYGRGRTLIRRFDITNDGSKSKYSAIDTFDYTRIQTLSRLYSNAPDPALTDAISLLLGVQSPTSASIKIDSPIVQTAIPYSLNIPAGANPYRNSNSPTKRLYSDVKNAVEKLRSKSTTVSIEHDQKTLKESNYAYYGKKRIFDSGSIAIYSNTTQFDRADANILTTDFYIINPFNQTEDLVRFSAYMKGFKNNFDATWNEFNYVGRSESFYTYGKFKSSVSFTLDIPCFNKEQLFEKHRALGQLSATTAGSYNENNLLSGVLLKVKIGNYLNNEYAILNSISYDIPDDSSWDIDEKLAMYLKVNISLTIIYKDLPQYKKNEGFFKQLRDANPTFLNADYKKVLASQRQ